MKRIKLVGIRGDHHYESWRIKTKQVLRDLKLLSIFEEVNDVDAIINFDISSIPALVVNDTVLLEQNNHLPDFQEIKDSILNYLITENFKMEKIVVPTDFSDNALNAYQYASDLAKAMNSEVKVVHVCYPNQDSLNGISIPTVEELMKHKNDQLDLFVENGEMTKEEAVGVVKKKINKEVIIGFPKEEIINLSKQKDVDLILMGTTGSGNMLEKMFGSVSSDVSLHAHCPVLLVPPGFKFNGVKDILYAGNYESVNERMLHLISDVAEKFEANIHMVHVCSEKTAEKNKIEELILQKLASRKAPEKMNFEMSTIVCDRIWEGLDQYADEKNADMVVIVTKHRNFWEGIRHKSVTKQMVFNARVPLLILHLDN